ncbi:MAG: serine aminopeptidase domain-containing protein [Phycisphaerales bacterium JB039]
MMAQGNRLRRAVGWALACACAVGPAACSGGGGAAITVATVTRTIESADGTDITTHLLTPYPEGQERDFRPWGAVGYAQDAGPRPVLNVTPQMAHFVAVNMTVALVERRGVTAAGAVNETVYWLGATRQKRIEDHLAAIRREIPTLREGRPLIVIGRGAGGAIAAAVAAREPRVTHLILIGAGGGWTGAAELRHWLKVRGEVAGIESAEELEAALEAIRADPESLAMLGPLAYRSWSGRLDRAVVDDLEVLDIPILLVQGDADQAFPAQSGRAARDRFKALGKDNLTYVELERLDEQHRDTVTGADRSGDVQRAVIDWLQEQEVLSARSAKRLRERF